MGVNKYFTFAPISFIRNTTLKMKNKSLLVAAVMLIGLTSCLKDLNKFADGNVNVEGWEPSVAVPLVYSKLDASDILASTNPKDIEIIEQNTGFIALVYRGNLASYEPNDIVALPSLDISFPFALTPTEYTQLTTTGSFQKSVSAEVPLTFTNSTIEIDSAVLKIGSLTFNVTSSFKTNTSITISIPALRKNGVPFTTTLGLNNNSQPNVNQTQSFDLTDYHLNFTSGSTAYNKIPVTYSINMTTNGSTVSNTSTIDFSQSMQDLNYKVIYGYFGNQDISADADSIQIKLFNNALTGQFLFSQPTFTMNVHNTLGFPAQITINSLQSYTIATGVTTNILYTTFTNPFTINYPFIVGNSATTSVVIDNSNSLIAELVTPTPKYLIYDISAKANPNGTPPGRNFMTDSSRFSIDTELMLPLEGYAGGFVLQDTFDFKLTDNVDQIKDLVIVADFKNRFPIDAFLQVFFTDSNYVVLDSLIDNPDEEFIKSASLDGNGRVSQVTQKRTEIAYSSDRVPNLKNSKFIIIRGKANTTGYNATNNSQSTVIKVYSDYDMEIRLGLKVNASIDLNTID